MVMAVMVQMVVIVFGVVVLALVVVVAVGAVVVVDAVVAVVHLQEGYLANALHVRGRRYRISDFGVN